MTETELIAALSGYLQTALTAVEVTGSNEAAVQLYNQGIGWVLITRQQHEPNRWQGEDKWTLLIQCSMSLQPGAQPASDAVSAADTALCDELNAAINGDAGFAALMALGCFDPQLSAGEEDQGGDGYTNAHTFTCRTY